MKKIIQYITIKRPYTHYLDSEVNGLISKGWQPHGNAYIHTDYMQYATRTLFCQAMVKYEK